MGSPRRLLLLAAMLAACRSDPTQLVVVVDTDLEVPAELGFVAVEIGGPGGDGSSAGFPLAEAGAVPFSFAVVPKDGDASREITIAVRGFDRQGGTLLVERRAVTGFLENRSLLLTLFLERACRSAPACGEGETCIEGTCGSDRVPPETLPEAVPGRELPSKRDAGMEDAGGDAGIEDAGAEDGGTPDGGIGCTAPAAPALLGTIDLGHGIAAPLAAADLDGDGAAELIALDPAGSLSVIGDVGCGPPKITTASVPSLPRRVVVGRSASGPILLLAREEDVARYRYHPDDGLMLLSPGITAERPESIAIAPGGASGITIARRGPWGVIAFDLVAGTDRFFETDRMIVTAPAYLAAGLFYAADDQQLLLLAAAGSTFSPLQDVSYTTSARVRPDAELRAALVSTGATLTTFTIDPANLGSIQSSTVSFGQTIAAPPTPSRAADGTTRVYLSLAGGALARCDLAGGRCVRSAAGAQLPSSAPILTGYIDGDADPDPILVTSDAAAHFRRGGDLGAAAEPVPLGGAASAAPVLVPSHPAVDRALLAVPLIGGRIALVGWKPPSAPPDGLWTHARGDAGASNHLP